jgi:addiction module RelE/StbE family toxin
VRVEWAPLALADREAIFDFIEATSPRTAAATDERIAATVRRLSHFPGIGRPGRVSGTRELIVDGAHLVIAYRCDEESVTVLRVLHTSRRWPDALD